MKYPLIIIFLLASGFSMAAPALPPKATPPLSAPLAGWQTWDSSGQRILPSSLPPTEATNATLRLVTALDATATATFAIRSTAPLKALSLKPGSLKGQNGGTIAPSSFDLHVVKCWYQDANAWATPFRAPGNSVLVPELLLHDDTLVLTDPKTRENLIRTSPQGTAPTYRRIRSASGSATVPPQKGFVAADDAKKLLPLSIDKDETRLFHLAIAIPPSARPGIYHGTISLAGDGRDLGHFNISLRIIDYLLPAAASRFSGQSHLDGTKVPTGSAPAVLSTNPVPFRSIVAPPQDRPIPAAISFLLRSGVTDPIVPPSALADHKRLFGTLKPESLWIASSEDLQGPPRAAPALAKALKVIGEARRTGISDIHLFLPSRLSGDGLVADAKTFAAVDDQDVHVWTYATEETYATIAALIGSPMCRGLPPTPEGWGFRSKIHDLNYDVGHFDGYEHSDTRPIERWHKIGVPFYLCPTYPPANEDPSAWRRHLGAECYYLGYDGFVIPSIMESTDPWNEWASPLYRSRTFLYPTKTGFIQTLAWHGVREGILDARYLSGVNRLATAIRTIGIKNPLFDLEGRRAALWLDSLHIQRCDLDTMRLDAIAWIDRLRRCLELEVHDYPHFHR